MVYVTSYERHEITNATTIDLMLEGENGISYYALEVQETEVVNSVEYNSAALLDVNGNLLVGLSYAWPVVDDDPAWVSVTERTPDDVLRIKTAFGENTITETYDMNGQTKSVTYQTETSLLARVAPELNRDSTIAELAQWEPLVDPDNTLNYNQDGEFFVKVLTNSDFVEWAEAEFGNDGLGKQTIDPEKLCAIAGAVSMLKCFFGGGWMNFICIAATGIGIACIVGVLAN